MSGLDHPDLPYLLALTMAPFIGPVTARVLLEKSGSARSVFREKPEILQKLEGVHPHQVKSLNLPRLMKKAEEEMGFLERHRIRVIGYREPEYPVNLAECPDGPVLLFTVGKKGLNSRKMISVVGTRKATSYGRDLCQEIIGDLSVMLDDLSIVSGLAYGIDVIAHRAALSSGIPTVAVLGHGFSTIYPPSHRSEAQRIAQEGSLITDFPSAMGPERNNFLRRNRIIAGLSSATLVVESALRGGALITARIALSYGRDVLAVPGRTIDERSKGCNNLILESHAGLVGSAEDVLYHLNWSAERPAAPRQEESPSSLSDTEKRLLLEIARYPGIDPSALCRLTRIPVQKVLSGLLELELQQWVLMEPGNCFHLKKSLPDF